MSTTVPPTTSSTESPISSSDVPPISSTVPVAPGSPDTAVTPTTAEHDPASCLHGPWVADNAYFLALIQELGDEVDSVQGSVLLQFADDGTFTTEYRDWTITAISEGVEVRLVRTGTDVGTYSAADASIDLADTTMGSTTTMTAAGVVMNVEPTPTAYVGASYSCDGSAATITTADGALQLARP